MTRTMRAFGIETAGAAPAFRILPCPAPGPGEVAVAVRAAALNFADTLMVAGRYQETPQPPFTLGLEYAGVVTALGAGVAGPEVGTSVAVYAGHGGLADVAVAPAEACVPIPPGMPFDEAAAFQIAYGTSHLALTGPGRLRRGERMAVLGAAGGVGLTAVELGACLGADVIAVARGADRGAAAEEAGAHASLDAEHPDLRGALKAMGGVDVVYDAVGGSLGEAAFGGLNRGGRHLLIGFASGRPPSVPANHMLVKNVTLVGFNWGGYRTLDPAAFRSSLEAAFDLWRAGALRPKVTERYRLDEAAAALARLASREATGKIVVLP